MSYENYYGTQYSDAHSKSQHDFDTLETPRNRNKFIDVHELQKQEIILQGGAGGFIADGKPLQDQFRRYEYLADVADDADKEKNEDIQSVEVVNNQETFGNIKDHYIYFDSTAKKSSLSDLNNGVIRWEIPELNQNQSIGNVIEMEIGNFYIPNISTATGFPQYFFYDRLNILLEEAQSQSIRAQNATRFHWELDVQPAGISYSATPVNKKFIFQKPVTDISTATFRLTAPLKRTAFQPDVMTFASQAGTSPARITTSVPHGLTVASTVAIFVSGFTSGVTSVDLAINDEDGFLVTVIDATTLEFPAVGVAGFDFTAVGVVSGQLVVGFRRIAFQVRFRSLTDEKTNAIVPV